jgi:CP family cyanate transporter-like MFS transporter
MGALVEDGGRVTRRPESEAARLTVLLLLMTIAAFIPWFGVSALGPVLIDAFDASLSLPGRLLSAMFVTSSLSAVLMGRAFARFGAARVLHGSFALCAATLILMSIAPNLIVLTLVMLMAGIMLGVPMTAGAAVASARLPREQRGSVIGLAQSGQQVGALLSGLILPTVAVLLTWRHSFAAGALGALLLWAAFSLIGFPTTPPQVRPEETPQSSTADGGLPIWIFVYGALMGGVIITIVAFLPVYGVNRFELSSRAAGNLVTTLGLVSIGGKILWGWLVQQVERAEGLLIITSGLAALSVGIASLPTVFGIWTPWLAAIACGLGGIAWPVVALGLVSRRFSPAESARIAGYIVGSSFVGAAIGPYVFGYALETLGFASAWSLMIVQAAIAGTLALIHLRRTDLRRSQDASARR